VVRGNERIDSKRTDITYVVLGQMSLNMLVMIRYSYFFKHAYGNWRRCSI